MSTSTATAKAATIEVLTVSAVSAGSLRAFASVRIGPALVLNKCRVIQQVGQKPWISMPQEHWTDREGTTQYAPVVVLTGTLKARVEAAIMTAALAQGVVSAVGVN
jgi:DNA-binding cell septation regulator SpoVG